VKKVIAFDFGASGGRAMLGTLNGTTIEIKEIHRFSNDPVILKDTMFWDFLRLFHEIKQGLIKAKKESDFDSIGIDTWGVDFGLLDGNGQLLENPVHYRDSRTKGKLEESFLRLPKEEFYQITGNQFMEINTAFQLFALAEQKPELLQRAETMLLMPDLFNYFLTGVKASEISIASTTQLLEMKKGTWSNRVLTALGIPERIFTPIVASGTKIGALSDRICEELDLHKCDVIAVAGHDTQSAMVAVPTQEEHFIYISCGTWSLLGTELSAPLIDERSNYYNITNEIGFDGKTSLLKNITGLWLIQESRRQWMREGTEYSFGELEKLAKEAKPLQCFIDPDASEFGPAGNMPKRIKEYCNRTGQVVPQTIGEIVRCIDESLALKYRFAVEEICDCTGIQYNSIHMVGGGIQSQLLCKFTANACGRRVVAGPVEATVLGNIAVQLIALGEIKDIKEARAIIANSPDIISHEPEDQVEWAEAYNRYKEVLNRY
jgi:rhamnulokinase/L-fuculokinase